MGRLAKKTHCSGWGEVRSLAWKPIHTGHGWFWAPTIGRALYKLGWTTISGGRDLMAIQTGVCAMHRLCSRHVPIIADVARRVVALRSGCRLTPIIPDPNRPWEWCLKGAFDYDDLALESTARAYSFPSTAGYPVEFPQIITVPDILSAGEALNPLDRRDRGQDVRHGDDLGELLDDL